MVCESGSATKLLMVRMFLFFCSFCLKVRLFFVCVCGCLVSSTVFLCFSSSTVFLASLRVLLRFTIFPAHMPCAESARRGPLSRRSGAAASHWEPAWRLTLRQGVSGSLSIYSNWAVRVCTYTYMTSVEVDKTPGCQDDTHTVDMKLPRQTSS